VQDSCKNASLVDGQEEPCPDEAGLAVFHLLDGLALKAKL
jgi:hypothetical protein